MVDDSGTIYSETRIAEIDVATAQFPDSQIVPRRARYLPGGGWIVMGNDLWYISRGLRNNQLRRIKPVAR